MRQEFVIEHGIEYLVEYHGNAQYWRLNGRLHRIHGPASIWSDGTQNWYYQNKWIAVKSQQEFEQWLKLKSFT